MNRKVKTIARNSAEEFDSVINEFITKDYVKVENISYTAVAAPMATIFIAHIEYIDVRQ